jgi:triphosphoribosyl-dephospho-CoA synthase
MNQAAVPDFGCAQQPAPGPGLQRTGRAAVAALYDELALEPKPGLVSFSDSGSHDDMDARTFMRSLFSLRHYFPHIAMRGAAGADFAALERAGIAAEARMLVATNGINTHRGAIFCLGLLCASAGALLAQGRPLQPEALRHTLMARWGADLARRPARAGTAHGATAARQHGLRNAGAEAALGFPVLFETTWPALRAAVQAGAPPAEARLQALFETMAVLEDTNLVHRGGLAGLRHAQQAARGFVQDGGARRPDAMAHARAIHGDFIARRLSPGGAADMLAAACWLQRVCKSA